MGKNKYIESPEEFLKIWDEYKAYVDSNPDTQEVATGKGVVTISLKNPYLRQGFEAYVFRTRGFHVHQYIDNYENRYEEYLGVVTYARSEWQENQLSGALTGKYKAPTLIAKLNDIVDKKEIDATVKVTSLPVEVKPSPELPTDEK